MRNKIKMKEGYIEFERIGKEKHELFELKRIEVKPEHEGKGIGTKLFQLMLMEIIPYRKVFCTTHASNKRAHHFYESMGMQMEAVLPNHYYDGEAEIVYAKYGKGDKNES